ncbi:MAG: ATP-binding protein [Thermoleophilia bacterium]|nr:ATP-binding protein [Thermoleophilia bacterium]
MTTGEHVVRLTIPAKAEYVSLCRLALAGLARVQAFREETLADLKLAITEAASNSVRHAYADAGGVVEVVYRLDPRRLEVEVADTGAGFDLEPRDGNGDELSEGGLGIAIIRAIADEFELSSDAGGSRLRFVKRLA